MGFRALRSFRLVLGSLPGCDERPFSSWLLPVIAYGWSVGLAKAGWFASWCVCSTSVSLVFTRGGLDGAPEGTVLLSLSLPPILLIPEASPMTSGARVLMPSPSPSPSPPLPTTATKSPLVTSTLETTVSVSVPIPVAVPISEFPDGALVLVVSVLPLSRK